MKIGILTLPLHTNYGGILQAYALQTVLERMGHEVKVINRNTDYKLPLWKTPLVYSKRIIKNILGYKIPLFYEQKLIKEQPIIRQNTDRFIQRYIHTLNVDNYTDLKAEDFDAVVVGSDQVWNPRIPIAHGPFFLDFAPPKSPRVSYASSFGVDHLPEQAEPYFRKWLAPFSAISVREQKGVEIVRQLTGKEAEHVLDPTLLLTAAEWDCIAAKTQPRDHYLLLYDLLPSAKIIQFAKEVASHLNLKIYRICRDSGTKQEIGITQFPTAGPQDFLTLFKNSSYIVTNSFHGMVFSILFEKEFRVLIPETMKNGGRISSLLQLLQLEQNAIKESELKNLNIKHSTDYSKVNTLLRLSRKKSEDYLRRTLAL